MAVRHAIVAMALTACSPQPRERTAPVSVPAEPSEVRDVAYRSDGAAKHRLDVFRPAGGGAHAVVMFVHGGYWVSGDRQLYAELGRVLARQGLVTVIPSYRLAPEVRIDGMLDDVLGALGWTQAHAAEHGGDPARVFVMGHSAGGHIAALFASDPRGAGVRGFIALSPILDVPDMQAKNDDGFNAEVTAQVFGSDPEIQRRYSPVTHFSRTTRPLLLAVGSDDFPYMIPQAHAARAKLAAAGAPFEFHELAGYDHFDMIRRFGEPSPLRDAVLAFVTKP
jgi:acetyl esterase/lipase